MDKHPLRESLWKRGWQGTVHGWKSVWFIILEAILAPLLGFIVDWWWSIIAVAGGMFCIWIGATIRAPVKQRDEAWELVEQQRKQRNKLSKYSDVKQVTEELRSLSIFSDMQGGVQINANEVLYRLKDKLAKGISVSEVQTDTNVEAIILQLDLRQIVQLEQRKKISKYGPYDEGYWRLTERGKEVIRYLETNKQVLDMEDSQS